MTMPTGLGISDLLQDQRDAIVEIANKHGAYNVRVFGSVARGEATADSDIDLLIDYDLERITPWFPAGLMLDLEKLLHRKVDVVSEKSLHYFLRDRILQEAVTL
jgi:predicted nucleotidyltransferase